MTSAMKAAVRWRVEIKERLKAPTSISFHSADVRYGDAKDMSMVIGVVNAQNSVGAKLRSRSFGALSQQGNNWVTNEIVFEQG